MCPGQAIYSLVIVNPKVNCPKYSFLVPSNPSSSSRELIAWAKPGENIVVVVLEWKLFILETLDEPIESTTIVHHLYLKNLLLIPVSADALLQRLGQCA